MAMLASEVRPKGPSTGVAVLNELAGRLDVGCTKVEHEERFHGRGQAPVHKLAQTELVALHRLPGNILPARSAFTRPDAVAPVVRRYKVPARVAHDAHAQLPDQVNDVSAETIDVARGVTRVVDAAIDRPAQVLDERPA